MKIPVFITSFNNRVVAREGEYFTEEIMGRSARMGRKFEKKMVKIEDTQAIKDLEKLLTRGKNYQFITENLRYLKDIVYFVGQIEVPEKIILELNMLKEKYSYNYHHIMGVTALTARIARDFFLDDDKVMEAAEAALLYDIGIGHIPQEIIQKVGRLTDKERSVISYHPLFSALLIAHYYQDDKYHLIEPILNHHENLDGSGYPRRVKNDNVLSHIIKLSDTFDALISARPFRKFYTLKEAFKICEDEINAGKISPEILPIIYSYYVFIDQFPGTK